MNSQQVQYILMTAELRSISKAAQRLYVTQSSLSQSIKNIEKQLGVTLFDRSVSPIRLTTAGTIYVDCAKRFQSLETELQNALADCAALKRGTLKIGASPFRIHCMLATSIAQFHGDYEGIQISLQSGEWASLQQSLLHEDLDLVIGSGSVDNTHLQAERLAEERLYLAASPAHPFCRQTNKPQLTADDIRMPGMKLLGAQPIAWEELSAMRLLVPEDKEYGSPALIRIFGAKAAEADTFPVDSLETAFAFVMGNLGLALLPDSLIRFGNYQQHPVYYALDAQTATHTIQLLTRKQAYYSQATVAYANCLRQLIDIGTWRTTRSTDA